VVTSRLPGLVLTDHELEVPLDRADPGGRSITVYAREVVAPRREHDDLPWLLFLQGGPGGKAPRPTERTGWLERALRDHRVLLLDQRGTGRSTPATRQTLAGLGSPEAQARYLTHFRADAIVRDAEAFRRALLGPEGRWRLLGQSYGGFCAVSYLSAAPEHLDAVLLTGGLPPLSGGPDVVYAATYPRMQRRTAAFYARYPGDERRAADVADALAGGDVRLPSGDPLPVERFQQLGHAFGTKDGYDVVHHLLEEAFAGAELSDVFLAGVEAATSFLTQPLYAVLHEPVYCQGEASRWSAQRLRASQPWLDPAARPLGFTGEVVYPWMFDVDAGLRPLAAAAELLAQKADWPALYDPQRLAANEEPVVAAVYHDDLYVDAGLSLQTAAAIRGARTWVTSEHEHDGLRRGNVLDRLLDMAAGEA
jgi:pimeloyl-ACP methyl ester carboxylesterase